ncbi:hypothetical protein [Clostridium tetani]|uniref:hypothetical protein n=1 Tax=Clostridium tetani TaxID=1513 RepID=UPI0039C87B2C
MFSTFGLWVIETKQYTYLLCYNYNKWICKINHKILNKRKTVKNLYREGYSCKTLFQ